MAPGILNHQPRKADNRLVFLNCLQRLRLHNPQKPRELDSCVDVDAVGTPNCNPFFQEIEMLKATNSTAGGGGRKIGKRPACKPLFRHAYVFAKLRSLEAITCEDENRNPR